MQASFVLDFIFSKDGGYNKFFESELVRNNEDEFRGFLLYILSRIFNAEPLTNIKLSLIGLIDQQSILDSKHNLINKKIEAIRRLPSLQLFKESKETLDWKNIINESPKQIDNIEQRPRDIFGLYFAIINAFEENEKKEHLKNYSILVKLQFLNLSIGRLFPMPTRRSKNFLSAMAYENPKRSIMELGKNKGVKRNYIESIESILLGQPLKSGVCGVSIIERKIFE